MGGDEVVTACQAACPTKAIVFGNLNDPNSAVVKAKASSRNYALLAELNTRPARRIWPSSAIPTLRSRQARAMNPTDPESAYTRATAPILGPEHTYASVTDKISALVLVRPYNWRWFLGMGIGLSLTLLLFVSIAVLFYEGVGIWGIDVPVMWGFAIVNFVWWIGIGHAGTLISAILLLLKQDWRTSINRFAEAMTLFAVACAGLFPLLHLGRPWLFYWLLPYPNTMALWPQWRVR